MAPSSFAVEAIVCGMPSLGRGVENVTEQFPAGAVPALETHLRPDHVVLRAGVHLDSRQGGGTLDVLQRLGLAQNICTRQILAALLQDLRDRRPPIPAGPMSVCGRTRAPPNLPRLCKPFDADALRSFMQGMM